MTTESTDRLVPGEHMTEPGIQFLAEQTQIASLLYYVYLADDFISVSRAALRQYVDERIQVQPAVRAALTINGMGIEAAIDLRTHEQALLRMAFCRSADNYELYLERLLRFIFDQCPRTMVAYNTKSHLTSEQVVRNIARRPKDILTCFKQLDIQIFRNNDDILDTRRVVETRNLIVHNQGIVTAEYLKKTGPEWSKARLGDHVQLQKIEATRVMSILVAMAVAVDMQAIQKYDLPWRRLGLPLDGS